MLATFEMPEDSRGFDADPDSASRASRRRPLVVAAILVLVAAMGAHLIASRDELVQLRRLSPSVLIAAAGLQFLAQLSWNGAMLVPLRLQMPQLGFWELLMVRAGGFLVGVMVPLGGNVAVRLAYLRKRGLTYAEFAWATLLTNSLALLSIAGVAAIAVAALWQRHGRPPTGVMVLTGVVLAAGAGAVTFLYFLPRGARYPWLAGRPWAKGLANLTATRPVIAWIVTFALARHLGNFLTFGVLYRALSPNGDVLTGGLVYALTSPARVVQVVPGNIGVSEWLVAAVGAILSYDLTTGLLVAVVFRGMTLLAQGLGALAAGAWLALRAE
jgi:uncharacterized membrane protein YbhN (UPF0104 family)